MTSRWPPAVIEAFCQALIRATSGKGDMLEVGTGSGRLTLPLLAQGAKLFGLDRSHDKLLRLLDRAPNLPVVQADGAQMPWPAASFDAVITIHVMHLVSQPQQVLQEIRRVLRPEGVYLRRDERPNNSLNTRMRDRWQALLEAAAYPQRHQARTGRAVDEALLAMGADCQRVAVTHIDHSTSPRSEIEHIAGRVKDGAWLVPEAQLPDLLAELAHWATAECGSLAREYAYREEFAIQVWRF